MPSVEGIEAIIAGLNLREDLSPRIRAVIYGYFDDSGTHDPAYAVTMAGYVTHLGNWNKFERCSGRLFKKENINIFHAKEFFHTEGEFDGWQDAQQLRFATEWYDIARPFILRGATISIDKISFNKTKKEYGVLPNTSPYAYCLNIVLEKLCRDGEVWEEIEKHGLSIILEAGNPKRDRGVEITFHEIAKHNYLQRNLRSLTTAPKESSRALQLGDYLAYFSWQQAEKAARGTLNQRSVFHDIAIKRVATHLALADAFTPNPAYRRRGAK